MTAIQLLEEKHMLSTLLYLRGCENFASRKCDIYRAVSTNPRMPDKLDKLEADGLVTQTFDESTRATIVALTLKGEQAADTIADLEAVLV